MGSIGDTFTPAVPAVGASGTGYATSVNAVLTELITRVSSTVPFSALSGSTLDLNNIPAIDFKYLGLYEQTVTPGASPVGRLERFENNLYWVGLSGAVKITNGANLNAAGIGGIGGDYGGANPALVSFVDASNRYDFYDDSSGLVWAHIRCRSIDISGTATGTNFAKISFGGGSNYTLTLPATLPTSGIAVLTLASSGALARNSTADAITDDIVLNATAKIQHGDRTLQFTGKDFYQVSGTWGYSIPSLLQATVAGTARIDLSGLQQGWRIKSVKVRHTKNSAGITTIKVFRSVDASGTELATLDTTTSGIQTSTLTLGTPYTLATLNTIYVQIAAAANNDALYTIELTYDVV